MWTALKRLGWSPPKIGSVFERDWRTVKRVIETYESQHPTAAKQDEQNKALTRQEMIDTTSIIGTNIKSLLTI